ncbi:MAG: hypothetical protein ACLQHT_22110 [Terracidiphilus sp.]
MDEDVTLADILTLAKETGTDLLYYREVGIWRYGDYAHVVLGRYQRLTHVALREYRAAGLKEALLGRGQPQTAGRHNYLGWDVLRPSPRIIGEQFRVTTSERQRLASAWFEWNRSQVVSQ